MNTRQIIAYAKENGYNSVKFSLRRGGSHLVAGSFLDAYFEIVQIPLLGDGFVMLSRLEQELGYDIEFAVITDEEYKSAVRLDFMLRGKPLPEKFDFESEGGE